MSRVGLIITGIILIVIGAIIFVLESSDITMKIASGSIAVGGLAFLVESMKKNK